ncbi:MULTISPECIES: hypothetical protein [Acinetobacter]|uniref:Uncharacterized protein n=3 Tax=Acinetobacter piscicola TaxID=2006115 RepID=A0A7S6VW77_9GAMM|nr:MULTISPECIES: hypothetical protein [Acinetobacter]MDM1758185.1 hypothetical protein [Acinetobacter sp. 256-1]MDM1760651.1 hypothetical protein [Acinetobacter sp. 251-1]QOW46017.1 hypothetical protein G0028_08975 [Acinetobacter piscicola]
MSDLDIHPDLFAAICRITANHIPSYENEWCLKLRDELFRESEIASCGLGFDTEILYTTVPEQKIFKYRCFKSTDILIQNMEAVENLSAWAYMGLDWSDNFDTQYLKQASKLMLTQFEKPDLFPQKKQSIVNLIDLLLKHKCGYELRDIEGQYTKYFHDRNDFYCTDNMQKVEWYDLVYIVTLPNAKSLIPIEIQHVLDEFECAEYSYNLIIKL